VPCRAVLSRTHFLPIARAPAPLCASVCPGPLSLTRDGLGRWAECQQQPPCAREGPSRPALKRRACRRPPGPRLPTLPFSAHSSSPRWIGSREPLPSPSCRAPSGLARASTRKHAQAHASTRKHAQARASTRKHAQARASTRKRVKRVAGLGCQARSLCVVAVVVAAVGEARDAQR
jgi:hypothetical protein